MECLGYRLCRPGTIDYSSHWGPQLSGDCSEGCFGSLLIWCVLVQLSVTLFHASLDNHLGFSLHQRSFLLDTRYRLEFFAAWVYFGVLIPGLYASDFLVDFRFQLHVVEDVSLLGG